jgi:hypothetical protein
MNPGKPDKIDATAEVVYVRHSNRAIRVDGILEVIYVPPELGMPELGMAQVAVERDAFGELVLKQWIKLEPSAVSANPKSSDFVAAAAGKLDSAVQLCGDEWFSTRISLLEDTLDHLATKMRECGL